MIFCTECGHHLAGSSRFCTGCGALRSANETDSPVVKPPVAELARQPQPRQRLGGWAAVAAVMALAMGALLAWHFTDRPAGPGALAPASPTPTSPVGTGPAPASALAVSPVASGKPSAASDGPVSIGSGAAPQSSAGQVAAFLGTYFAAINHRDYQTYIDLFDYPARPDRSEQEFLSGYQTTTDSDPVLAALTPTSAGGWAATVTFVSHQSPAASATHSSCTTWDITLYLEPYGHSYLIGLPPAGYQAARAAC